MWHTNNEHIVNSNKMCAVDKIGMYVKISYKSHIKCIYCFNQRQFIPFCCTQLKRRSGDLIHVFFYLSRSLSLFLSLSFSQQYVIHKFVTQ